MEIFKKTVQGVKVWLKGGGYVAEPYLWRFKISIFFYYCFNFIKYLFYYLPMYKILFKKINKNSNIAVLLGNGPSVDNDFIKLLLSKREKFDLYTVNYFNKNTFSENLIPDYHFLSDGNFFDFESVRKKKENKDLLNYLKNKNISTLVPVNHKNSVYPNEFCFNDDECFFFKFYGISQPRFVASNSVAKILRIIKGLDYKYILVSGFDYNYFQNLFVDQDLNLVLKENHSYGKSEWPWNIYFKDYSHALSWFHRDLESFKKISKNNIYIYSEHSVIDFFNRTSLKEMKNIMNSN